MRTKQITRFIHIEDDDKWGSYNEYIVFGLIMDIETEFSNILARNNTKKVYILHKEGNPLCINGIERIIFLSTKSNRYCQWIYQFAHEYCHHLIDGAMSGEIKGLLWFEETICELSSLYHLTRFYEKCSADVILKNQAPLVRDYLNDFLYKNQQLVAIFHRESLSQWGDLLKEPVYHRDLYNAMAVASLPIVLKTPQVWKMILHFGDIRKWNSLEELFEHLLCSATDDYRQSLLDLKKLFLP